MSLLRELSFLLHLSSLLPQVHTVSHCMNFSVGLMWIDRHQ